MGKKWGSFGATRWLLMLIYFNMAVIIYIELSFLCILFLMLIACSVSPSLVVTGK